MASTGRPHGRGAGPVGDVGIARRVDHALARMASRPAFDSVTMPDDRRSTIGGHELPVQHGVDAGLLHEPVRHQLEALGIELVAQRLAFRHGRPHGLGPLLELAPDPARFDRPLVAVPGEALDPDGRDVAAETAEPLDQGDCDPGAGGRQRRSEAAWPRSDHEHVGLVDHVEGPGRLVDGLGHAVHLANGW